MPIGTFKSVREVSSEDAVHVAANLLQQEPGKKWKTKSVGEKSAYVILELEEAQRITGIDIGNEHAAFVEVLVGKAGCSSDGFTEILFTSSFMTPIESKNSTTVNRVRCFNQEALVSSTVEDKWQLVKVICTQPFNKHVQYGLSFIKVHVESARKPEPKVKSLVPEKFLERKSSTEATLNQSAHLPKLGKFVLREDSPDSESESSAALFARWKAARHDAGETTAAAAIREASKPGAIREASRPAAHNRFNEPSHKNTLIRPKVSQAARVLSSEDEEDASPPVLDRNRDHLGFGDDDNDDDMLGNAQRNQKLSKQIEADKERLREESEKLKKQKESLKRRSIESPSGSSQAEKKRKPLDTTPSTSTAVTPKPSASSNLKGSLRDDNPEFDRMLVSSPTRRSAKKQKPSAPIIYRPFHELLRGVVLVISGIQNPDRADLRNKALAMGAKYKRDWERGCTHLICAFKNTPKYNQVRGQGKIVTRSWIEKCFALKKYLPWRRYALDASDAAQPESDEEIVDESLKLTTTEDSSDSYDVGQTTASKEDAVLEMYDLDDNRRCVNANVISSGSDTEDDVERVLKKKKSPNANKENKSAKLNKSTERDVYDATTEEEEYLSKRSNGRAQQFFRNFKFFINDDVSAVEKIKLDQFIERYGGRLTKQLPEADYAITHEPLKSKALPFEGVTVRPLWIFECHDMETKVATERYLV